MQREQSLESDKPRARIPALPVSRGIFSGRSLNPTPFLSSLLGAVISTL
jgi:hypothetical protein